MSREIMVRVLVRYGTHDEKALAYKRDAEIEQLAQDLKRKTVVPDIDETGVRYARVASK